jgi:long-subunit fatty acid transport protein
VIAVCIGAASAAYAGLSGTPFTYGFGARGLAMAGAYTALSGDASSAFFNPGAMATLENSQLAVTYFYAQPEFEGGPKSDPFNFDHSNRVVEINVVQKLNTLLKKDHDVAFGVNLALDDNGLAFIRFYDVQNPDGYFVRYGSYGFTLNATLGFATVKWLYFGLGVVTTLHAESTFTMHTDLGGNTTREGNDLTSNVVFAPLAAAFLRFEPVDIGLTFHGRTWGQFNPIAVEATADVGTSELAELPMMLYFKDNYCPHRAGLGLLVRAAKWAKVTVDTVWYNWNDVNNMLANHDLPRRGVDIEFKDTFVPHLGLEFEPYEHLFVRAGYGYEETPVVKPGISYNMMLDSSKHIVGVGVGYEWQNPPLLRYPISFDVAYFGHYLVDTELESSDGQKYVSRGTLNGVAGTLALRY